MIAGGIVKKGLMVISLKANNQSFGPPSASKTLSRLVIVKALKGLNNPCGAASFHFSPYPTAHKKGP